MEGNATKISALGGDNRNHDLFFNKIISRTSSTGCSSRANYYCRSHEGVPFEWEMQPGTPKDPPRAASPPPPLSPPPAIVNLTLPKPSIEDCHRPEKEFAPRLVRLDVWKKIVKKYIRLHKKKEQEVGRGHNNGDHLKVDDIGRVSDVDKFEESFGFWSSDHRDDFMASSLQSSRSSSASSLSFSNGPAPAVESKKMNPLHDQPRVSCIPLKLNAILVYAAKRS